ncbi:hypothetical protein BMJ26_19245 [Sinorhizobium medicae]|nr:hypothetical protein BMJ31_21065 [Sinorhizobium medicae]PLU36343.1 hypothetical protein BMJ26_19245 [Sinorhizobium medicae]PLU37298.1 hypothetical protein BMJ27_08215 [Sinorhizobium medicae]PLU58812.1 hypothetical protein BMJ24_15560 [Sinorhizobium medicae]
MPSRADRTGQCIFLSTALDCRSTARAMVGGEAGTVRNSVRWAMMMKRRETSHGYRERTSGPAPGWT